MWVIRSRAWQALVAGALGVRLAVIELTRGYIPEHDDRSYLRHAIALERTGAYPVYHVAGHVVPTAYRAPAFPVLLALAHAVLGGGVEHERIAQALVGAALVGLVGVVSAEIWPRRTALVATALAAVSPVLVVFGASLISEPLFAALELAAVACALRAHGRARWARSRARPRWHGPRASPSPWASRCAPADGAPPRSSSSPSRCASRRGRSATRWSFTPSCR